MKLLTIILIVTGKGIKDAVSSFAGIRPVLSRGNVPPSKESKGNMPYGRKNDAITVTGGKLTTFRKLAWDALEAKAVRIFLMTEG